MYRGVLVFFRAMKITYTSKTFYLWGETAFLKVIFKGCENNLYVQPLFYGMKVDLPKLFSKEYLM